MIVVDASAMVEALVGREATPGLVEALADDITAPHLLDVEVLSALRGLVLGGKLEPGRAEQAIGDYFDLSVTRHEVQPLAERVWQLRNQHGAYDACYLALAEALEVPLLTCDAKLAGRDHRADVRVVSTMR